MRGDVVAVQFFERVFADAAEVGAPELHQRFALEGIELEIDFEVFFVVSQALHEVFFLRDADTVRVHHQVAMGRAFAISTILKKSGWTVGSPPESWTTSGWPSLRTTASNMVSTCWRVRNCWRSGPLAA